MRKPKTLIGQIRSILAEYKKPDADPEFYEAKQRCRAAAKKHGDKSPLFVFIGPRTMLYMNDDRLVNVMF